MKKILAALLSVLMLFSAAAAITGGPVDEPDSYVATGGWISDQQAYYGSWAEAYRQILNNHYTPIHSYQYRTLEYYNNSNFVSVPCKPVSLTDLTGDGIPELIFIEAASDVRGDLYIYSYSGTSASCILYVPGITRLGYDDVGLGFEVYLTTAGGGTLVIEYYEYEWPWVLQLSRNGFGRYSLTSYLRARYDNSGEGEDQFFRNGSLISYADYDAELMRLRNGRTAKLSTYIASDTSHYGFQLDYESALSMLNSSGGNNSGGNNSGGYQPSGGNNSWNYDGVYGLTIDKLSTRTGPGTQYTEGGTYSVKNQWIKVLAKAWDKRNSIWWVKCEIPYRSEIRVLWTGWKRFDHSTISLDDLPEESW